MIFVINVNSSKSHDFLDLICMVHVERTFKNFCKKNYYLMKRKSLMNCVCCLQTLWPVDLNWLLTCIWRWTSQWNPLFCWVSLPTTALKYVLFKCIEIVAIITIIVIHSLYVAPCLFQFYYCAKQIELKFLIVNKIVRFNCKLTDKRFTERSTWDKICRF